MNKAQEIEYSELLAYLNFFATVVWQIDPASACHPARAIEKTVRQYGKSKALAGLRQAANDTIEATRNWSLKALTIADDGFQAAGLITVSKVARRYSASYKRIIKRGTIRNETEYYLINANLIDQGNALSPEERASLQELIDTCKVRRIHDAF